VPEVSAYSGSGDSERFLKEPKALADYELLEIILFAASPRTDVKPLAKELIANSGRWQKF